MVSYRAIAPFLIALLAVTVIGFLGYAVGFLGFVYRVMMPETFTSFPLVILSVIFGVAAFFSPCSFSVLPAYVSHYLAGDPSGSVRTVRHGVRFGLTAAAGVITVNVIIGLVIALLGSAAPFAKDPRQDTALILGIRTAAGFLIAAMGLFALLDRPLPLPSLQRWIGGVNFRQSVFLYGLLYNGAAIGCTGPILLGLMLYALVSGSVAHALTAFVIFALTMGTLMVLLTAVIAGFGGAMAQRLLPATPVIKRVAGGVMVVVGLAIALLTLEGNRLFVRLFFPFLP